MFAQAYMYRLIAARRFFCTLAFVRFRVINPSSKLGTIPSKGFDRVRDRMRTQVSGLNYQAPFDAPCSV